jgi:hypothetical protein
LNRETFLSVAYGVFRSGKLPAPRVPAEIESYFQAPFMAKIAHGPLLKSYPLQRGAFVSEGDSPSYWHLLPTGLRSHEDPSFGGWGGRFVQTSPHRWTDWPTYLRQTFWDLPHQPPYPFEKWDDPTRVADASPYGSRWYDRAYHQARWIPALQNDFAARAAWQTESYKDANHPPVVRMARELRAVTVKPGQRVPLTASVTDPDGDRLSARWWQYREAGTYPGSVTVQGPEAPRGRGKSSGSFVVPRAARRGQTIHLILEVTDGGTPALTRYQRVIATVQ